MIRRRLDDWGAWDQQTSLIRDTLTWLPAGSRRQGAWTLQLGDIARLRGDYAAATRQYQRSADIFERLGDQSGMAASYGGLGIARP